MNTYTTIWNDFNSALGLRDITAFLDVLGKQTTSERAVIYKALPNGDSVVMEERVWPSPLGKSRGNASSTDPTSTLAASLEDQNLSLAIQRNHSYSQVDREILDIACMLLKQTRARWELEDRCLVLEAHVQTEKARAQAIEGTARTWERRAEALDAYARGLTHQCLTHSLALNSLMGSIAKDTGFCPPVVQEKFRKLEAVAHRSAKLSEALLAGAKARAAGAHSEPLALPALLNEVRDELRDQISQNKAKIERSPLPTLEGDRHLWKTLLAQILSNAITYSRGPATINVEVASSLDEHHFIITDNGPGVPAKLRETVFAPFRRLHTAEEAPGVGLGLTVCREIVTQMGGKIWLSDPPGGEGLAVHFTVPRQHGQDTKRS